MTFLHMYGQMFSLDWLKLDVKDKKADGYTYNNDKTQVKIILDCKNEL